MAGCSQIQATWRGTRAVVGRRTFGPSEHEGLTACWLRDRRTQRSLCWSRWRQVPADGSSDRGWRGRVTTTRLSAATPPTASSPVRTRGPRWQPPSLRPRTGHGRGLPKWDMTGPAGAASTGRTWGNADLGAGRAGGPAPQGGGPSSQRSRQMKRDDRGRGGAEPSRRHAARQCHNPRRSVTATT